MALTLTLSSCQSNGCKLLTLTDTTGLYEATSNPGGWYGINTDLNADVAGATLVITDPDDNVYTIDIISDLGFDFPTATYDTLEYEVPNTLLGLASDESLPDGIYNVVYTIIDNADAEFSVERNFAVMCTASCDLADLVKRIPEQYNCNKCNTQFIDQVFLCYMLFKSAENAAYCGNISAFENIMTSLEILINNTKYEL